MSNTARLQFPLASAVANVRPRPRAAPVRTAVLPLSVNYRLLAGARYTVHCVNSTHKVCCHSEDLGVGERALVGERKIIQSESGEEVFVLYR